MRKIFVKYFGDNEVGDADVFYEEVQGKLILIAAWSNDDASYRSYRQEYMGPLMRYLGIDVRPLPKSNEKQARALLKDRWGF